MINVLITNTVSGLYNAPDFRFVNTALAQALDLFSQFNSSDTVSIIKTISLIATALLAVLFVIVVVKLRKIVPPVDLKDELFPPAPADTGATGVRWQEITKHINSTNESEWKFAVIEADKLVNEILKAAGFSGETIGERLMGTDKSKLVTLDGLWEAHKIRNRLVHDTDYFLRYAEAKRAILLYEKTLKELAAV